MAIKCPGNQSFVRLHNDSHLPLSSIKISRGNAMKALEDFSFNKHLPSHEYILCIYPIRALEYIPIKRFVQFNFRDIKIPFLRKLLFWLNRLMFTSYRDSNLISPETSTWIDRFPTFFYWLLLRIAIFPFGVNANIRYQKSAKFFKFSACSRKI